MAIKHCKIFKSYNNLHVWKTEQSKLYVRQSVSSSIVEQKMLKVADWNKRINSSLYWATYIHTHYFKAHEVYANSMRNKKNTEYT